MLKRLVEPPEAEAALFAALDPELASWFRGRFGHFAPAQRIALPEILAGRSVLLSSPTGSGKTLAAFMGVFNRLKAEHDRSSGGPPLALARPTSHPRSGQNAVGGLARPEVALHPAMVCVYVSPLRALAYDLEKNLRAPLEDLGWSWLTIGARTGDTKPAERAKQKRHPPHILVTTPETLTLLLSQPGWISALSAVRYLIIDELHALAENKRGALLMVAAERLEELSPVPLIRIGLSATVSPLEEMAGYLAGPGRPCSIAEVTDRKAARIEVFSPLRENAYPPAGYTAARVLRELGGLLETKRTTLIFTNTRSGAESIGLRLKALLPHLAAQIEVHHASLDRAVRLAVEDRLKRGELRAVVCSTSLEMGIDIGAIDTVVMVSAPKGVARALQRLGRSGHAMNRTSHGVLVASNINDLAECAVTARMMERRELEPVQFHEHPADVLAQHLVGLAVFGSVTADEAFALVRRSHPFRSVPREFFDRVLRYLAGGGVTLERHYAEVFGKVRVDERGNLQLTHPRVARDFYQNVGTINTETMVQVRLGRKGLGQVEESFMKGLRPGDVFVLAGRVVRLVETQLLTAKVERADGALPTVPRWYANKMPLASGLAAEVIRLRGEVAARLPHGRAAEAAELVQAIDWLVGEYQISTANARALTAHFALQARLSAIPTAGFFLIELFRERGLSHYFFHVLIGRSANDALSRLIAQRVHELKGGNALVTIDDYGFQLTLRPFQELTVEQWKYVFRRDGAEGALREALADAALVKWQFRGVAQTGLMVPRKVHGAERKSRSLQWSSEIIFNVLRQREPDHPLLAEAYAEATLRFLDLPHALHFLDRAATLPWQVNSLDRVSPFAFGIYVSTIKETMTLEDPETTIERLYHEMYGSILPPPHAHPA